MQAFANLNHGLRVTIEGINLTSTGRPAPADPAVVM